MKGICYILFGIVAFLFLPCVVVGQNVDEWQEPFDSSVAGKSLRQGEMPVYSAAYTILNQSTGWFAKMLKEGYNMPPEMY